MLAYKSVERIARKPPDVGVLERFDGEGIFLVDADAKEVAREHEPGDLPPAIGKQGVEL